MNIQIVSNARNNVGGENFNNTFTMPLLETIDGENEHKHIRVLNVSYPQTIENVREKQCGIRLRYHFKSFRSGFE